MHSLHTRPSRIQHTPCPTNRHHTSHGHQPKHNRTDSLLQTHIQQTHRKHNNTILSPLAMDTNINNLQLTQNTALSIAIECTTDTTCTKTQPLHDEAHILPMKEYLQLHASQIRYKLQHSTYPLHHNTTNNTLAQKNIQHRQHHNY